MLKKLMVAILCVASLCGTAAPVINVPEILESPKMDGDITDAVWQKAVKLDDFHLYKTEKLSKDTTAYIYRDKAWLYIAFKCDNDAMKHLKQTAFKHDDAACSDDSVEIFIDPGTNGKKCVSLC